MSLAMEDDELSNPIDVGLFSAITVVARPEEVAYDVKQFGHGEVPSKFG
jgi:hypothetical protein